MALLPGQRCRGFGEIKLRLYRSPSMLPTLNGSLRHLERRLTPFRALEPANAGGAP